MEVGILGRSLVLGLFFLCMSPVLVHQRYVASVLLFICTWTWNLRKTHKTQNKTSARRNGYYTVYLSGAASCFCRVLRARDWHSSDGDLPRCLLTLTLLWYTQASEQGWNVFPERPWQITHWFSFQDNKSPFAATGLISLTILLWSHLQTRPSQGRFRHKLSEWARWFLRREAEIIAVLSSKSLLGQVWLVCWPLCFITHSVCCRGCEAISG